MTEVNVDAQNTCPICSGRLLPRGNASYCPSCDLAFENGGDGGTAQ